MANPTRPPTRETITINATSGIPISLVGGTNGAAPSVTITYHVSQVTVSDIEAGRPQNRRVPNPGSR